ncbi:biotin transport system permease protein [Breoghania corrubedonensis]|uniref:Biotin transport system permease protein n=1 Tax=Breoghania corrubedonensis TaxID=665038 RepID=A0A2T5V9H8_9HYPH|nr:energy-coupling factor transporter transmembrane protein EcfT [Breoghania corrubedonensis]PTW60400.1 biotin transport system permease protein [Breoghania corrubedonensis]
MTRPRDPFASTLIHRLPAGLKLGVLAVAGTGVLYLDDWRLIALAMVVTLALYRFAGLSMRQAYLQLKPMQWILALLFVAQGFMLSWGMAAAIVLRVAALVLLAMLVTLTTRTDALIAAVERALGPLRRFGVNPAKVGLAFSLALRFIPVIGAQAQEIRDAQRARGLGANPIALALPLVLRTLRMASDVADAIEARSPYDDDELPPRFVEKAKSTQSRTTCKDNKAPLETSST